MSSPYAVLARFYDLQHNAYVSDAPLYLGLARRFGAAGVARILELGCGTGRVMAPLVAAGHTVVGVDESQEMLDISATRLAQAPSSLWRLITADARALRLEEIFDLAIIALNTFLHNATREDQIATLRTCRLHLRPGGALVADLPPNDELAHQPDDGQYQFEAKFTDPETGSLIVKHVASEVYWATQLQRLSFRMEERTAEGQRLTHETGFVLRHVFRNEMELLLIAAGFTHWDWYGSYDLGPYEDDSPRMIVVAR